MGAPTVLSYTNAFPGAAFPQHSSGQTTTVQNYVYPGAVQPQASATVLSYTNAFPNAAFSQHTSGQTTTVQSYVFPGAVQPKISAATVGLPVGVFPIIGGWIAWLPALVLARRAMENPLAKRREIVTLRWWLE